MQKGSKHCCISCIYCLSPVVTTWNRELEQRFINPFNVLKTREISQVFSSSEHMRRGKGIGNVVLTVALWPPSPRSINAHQPVHSNCFFLGGCEWGHGGGGVHSKRRVGVTPVCCKDSRTLWSTHSSCLAVTLSEKTCSELSTFLFIIQCDNGRRNFMMILTWFVLYSSTSNK